MDFRCVKLLLFLAFVKRISSLPLACSYNGTSYKEGKSVKTEEPCLSCVCQKGALECNLRVCAEYPAALPPACFLLHKPNDCCPQLLCEERLSSTDVDLRTGSQVETKLHGNDCVINGSVYAEGSAVAGSENCEYCYCVQGEMKCIKPRCLQYFGECKAVYEKSSCCPTHYDCRKVDVNYLAVQIKDFAKVQPVASSDSSISLSNEDLSLDVAHFNTNGSINLGFIKSKNASINESEKTTTEEVYTEETTIVAEKESTAPSEEDWATTNGFQTTKTENFDEESTKISDAETTTSGFVEYVNSSFFSLTESQKETSSVQIRSKTDFREESKSSVENRKNFSSQIVDDYDSYDYSEPQLPPSLPNLVIFPFVAADAVVKDESADPSISFEKVGIERIDAHPVFFKDYFSPPSKTEGGFVPKELSKSDEPFYEHGYHSREQMEPPSESLKENQEVWVHANNSLLTSSGKCVSEGHEIDHREIRSNPGKCVTCICKKGAVVCQDVKCSHRNSELISFENQKETDSTLKSDSYVTPDKFREAVRSDAEFQMKDKTAESHESHQTKKPVTVTYKNFVVDFYPNYLITTTRGDFKLDPAEKLKATNENLQHSTGKTQNTIVSQTMSGKPSVDFFDEADFSVRTKTTRETLTKDSSPATIPSVSLPTKDTSFFEEIMKSLLSNDASETTAATETANATPKYKYSSKIKGQMIATVEPKQEELREKVNAELNKVNLTTELYSWLNSIVKPDGVTDKTKNQSFPQKPMKKDNLKLLTKIPFHQLSASVEAVERERAKVELFEYLTEASPSSGSREESAETSASESGRIKPNAGALLKLAGCNIYGMMYRVGKVIAELSGPCLECLCTESGVQCRDLKC